MKSLIQRIAAIAALALCFASVAQQQAWPIRPVRIIVPFPAGGATDLVARAIAQRVSQNVGQQMLIENKAGAGGTLGSGEAARAAADGYTLLLTTSSTHAIAPHFNPKLGYDAVGDFTPIAHVANAANVLVVSPQLPVKSVAELIAHAKKNPGRLNYASSGNGTIIQLTTEAFKSQAGVFITHIPYKGTALAIPDLVAGNVQVLFDSIASAMPHVREGRLRALAVTGDRRSPLAPELPTVAESGLPGFVSITWFGVFAPRGLSPELTARIHDEFARAVQSADVVDRLGRLGAEPARPHTPAGFGALVAADSERWGRIIRDRKITLE